VRSDATPSDQAETFAAWRRLLEVLAEQGPLVLVFEDLHWADEGLLDFVDHLVDWVSELPLLVVCSARPELLTRRRDWGGGKPNATTLSLAPLSDEETARLIGAVLNKPLLDAEQQQALLVRAGGNPLFAEQYAQMLAERGSAADLRLPETVQGIISARLDALPMSDKQLLQDAAVIGKVFWPGAIAAIDGHTDAPTVLAALHGLERRQFVRRERRSSVAGESQYAFVHVLLRDAAYAQMPRPVRVEKHVRAARWIESLAGAGDTVEMLAHHYLNALELARASGVDITSFLPPARAALSAAGDRAQQLNAFYAAVSYFEAALSLWPEDAGEARADLMFRVARAQVDAGEDLDGMLLEEACAALEAIRSPAAAEAHARLTRVHWLKGDSHRAREHLDRAIELVGDAADSPRKAIVVAELARYQMVTAQSDLELARQSVALAEEFGLDELRANAVITLGTAMFAAGDEGGVDIVRQGLELALANKFAAAALRGYSNLGFCYEQLADLRSVSSMAGDSFDMARRHGGRAAVRWASGNLAVTCFQVGEWRRCDELVESFISDSAAEGSHYHDGHIHSIRAWMAAARGDVAAAREDAVVALRRAAVSSDPQVMATVRGFAAGALALAGDIDGARAALDDLLDGGPGLLRVAAAAMIDAVMAAELTGRRSRAAEMLSGVATPWTKIAVELGAGRYPEAADLLQLTGETRLTAVARLRAAEQLAAAGRAAEAHNQARAAADFFRSVGATALLRRTQELIPASA
jgi:tetratricopeptide (TPR) repeat protein